MTLVPDETLMAFADGELDAHEAARIQGLLSASPALRERLSRLQATDNILRAALSTSLDVPDRFAGLLRPELPRASSRSGLEDAGKPVPVAMARTPARRMWLPAGIGVAAALMVVAALGALSPQRVSWLEQVNDGIALSGPVLSMISATPSGQLAQAGGLHVQPILSFVSSDGRMCREAHVQDAEMAVRVLACRDNHVEVAHLNEWCIEAFTRVAPVTSRRAYQTAGTAPDPVIDAAYARLGRKEILDRAGEARTIRDGWKGS